MFLNLGVFLLSSQLFVQVVNAGEPQGVEAQGFSSIIPELLGRGLQPRQGRVCSIPGGREWQFALLSRYLAF